MHWCQDETNALILALTGGGGVLIWLKLKWYAIRARFSRNPQCPCGHSSNEEHI